MVAKCDAGTMMAKVRMESPVVTATVDESRITGRRSSEVVGSAVLLGGLFGCEVTASLLVGLQKRPGLGMLFVAAGIALALEWVRRHRRRVDLVVGAEIAAAKALLTEGRSTAAWNTACAAANRAAHQRLRNAALAVMVQVSIEEKNYQTARQVLARMSPRGIVDPLLEATIEKADGHPDRARQALEQGRSRPAFGAAAARLLVEMHAEADDLQRAVEVAIDCIDLLTIEEIRNMIASLEAWGEPSHAVALSVALTVRTAVAASSIRLSRGRPIL